MNKSKKYVAQKNKLKKLRKALFKEQEKGNKAISISNKALRKMDKLIREDKSHTKAYKSARKQYKSNISKANQHAKQTLVIGRKLDEGFRKLGDLE